MGRTIFLIIIIIVGFVLFVLGILEVKKNTKADNLLDSILSFFSILLNVGEFSAIGVILVGLLMMLIGILELVFK